MVVLWSFREGDIQLGSYADEVHAAHKRGMDQFGVSTQVVVQALAKLARITGEDKDIR